MNEPRKVKISGAPGYKSFEATTHQTATAVDDRGPLVVVEDNKGNLHVIAEQYVAQVD